MAGAKDITASAVDLAKRPAYPRDEVSLAKESCAKFAQLPDNDPADPVRLTLSPSGDHNSPPPPENSP